VYCSFTKKKFEFSILHWQEEVKIENIIASYVGASNNDEPAYFDIFKYAVGLAGIVPTNSDGIVSILMLLMVLTLLG
jgi:hypothetical protein